MNDRTLDELSHIQTKTDPHHLAQLRQDWDESKIDPIRLRESAEGTLRLRNGNHRLTLARERGDAQISAVIDLVPT